MSGFRKKKIESDFHGIRYRIIENVEEYEVLRKEVEGKATVNGKLDYYMLLDLEIDIQDRIEKFEHAKEKTLSINLPCAIMVPSVILSAFASDLLTYDVWGIFGAIVLFAILILFLRILVNDSYEILQVRRNNLLFHNTIKKIIDRAIAIENEKNK